MYICNLCMYSACGKAHLAIHAYLVHEVQPVPWHENDVSVEPQPSHSETKRLVRLKEYICGLCKEYHFRCLTTAMFREHLEQKHCGSTAYDCHLCLVRAGSPGVLLEHYRCDHGFFKVHCLYCDLGRDDDWFIMRHIMEKHPDKPFRLLLRNGDTSAVIQELRKLVEEYLSRRPLQLPMPQPFMPVPSQIDACAWSTQPTADIDRENNDRSTISSGQLCIAESVPLKKMTENACCSENKQQTVEMAVKNIKVDPEHPAVPLPQSLTLTSFKVEACSTESRSEAINDSTLRETNAENSTTDCKINENQHTLQMDVGEAESGEHQLSSSFGHAQCKTEPDNDEITSNTQYHVEIEVGHAESAECQLSSCEHRQSETEPDNKPTPTIEHTVEIDVGLVETGECQISSSCGHGQSETEPDDEPTRTTAHTVEIDVGFVETGDCQLLSCGHGQSETEPDDEPTPTIEHTVEMDMRLAESGECRHSSCGHAQNEAEPDNDRRTPTFKNTCFPGRQQFSCNIENCAMEFRDVFDFMNHLAECHPPQSLLHCPKCGIVVSPVDLLAHIVERHSGVIFCPYGDCSFGSQNQWDVDDHIIQTHQVYQEADQVVATTEAVLCAPDISPSASYAEEGCNDAVDTDNVLCYENDEADEQCDVAQTETAEGLTAKYLCGTCSTQWETTLSYIHHMTTVHSVPFFCGHCLKSYKRSRSLLIHAGYHHLGRPFSVWQLEDGKIVDVGKLVAPSWVHEAQCYLKLASRSRLQAKGKTMIKNLKIAIEYVTSAALANEVEKPQPSTISSHTDDQRSTCTTPETPTWCTEPMVDSSHKRVSGSPPLQDKALHESPSALDDLSDNGTDRSSEESNHSEVMPCVLNDFDIKPSPLQLLEFLSMKTPFCTKPKWSMNGKVHMRILSSVYIDASSCKKVNGSIAIEEEVLRKLSSLNTMHVHKKSASNGPSSLLSGVRVGSHLCSVCLISFGTFEELCKHFAKIHENASTDIDSASASISLQGNWKLQEFTSISNTITNVKPCPGGHVQFEHSKSSVGLHLKQIKSKCFKSSAITDNLFVQLAGARVLYSQLASITNLNPVVRLVRLPVIKQELP